MGMFCQPNRTADGQATRWGTVEPEALFGPQGWCTAAEPELRCECILDGGWRYCRGYCPDGACACACARGLGALRGWGWGTARHRLLQRRLLLPAKRLRGPCSGHAAPHTAAAASAAAGWGGPTCEDPYEMVSRQAGGQAGRPDPFSEPPLPSAIARALSSAHDCVHACLLCSLPQFCFNQCNGRGECKSGYCKCDPGGWPG